eukprot:scaffold54837_cov14-Tisochrysis_lutea.AAC.1
MGMPCKEHRVCVEGLETTGELHGHKMFPPLGCSAGAAIRTCHHSHLRRASGTHNMQLYAQE